MCVCLKCGYKTGKIKEERRGGGKILEYQLDMWHVIKPCNERIKKRYLGDLEKKKTKIMRKEGDKYTHIHIYKLLSRYIFESPFKSKRNSYYRSCFRGDLQADADRERREKKKDHDQMV